jgi:hypothetical protein
VHNSSDLRSFCPGVRVTSQIAHEEEEHPALTRSSAQPNHLLAREWKRKSQCHDITTVDERAKDGGSPCTWRIDDDEMFEIYAELHSSDDAKVERAND